jgi:hypothetical protein
MKKSIIVNSVLFLFFLLIAIPFVILWTVLGTKVMGIGFFIYVLFLIAVALILTAKLQ